MPAYTKLYLLNHKNTLFYLSSHKYSRHFSTFQNMSTQLHYNSFFPKKHFLLARNCRKYEYHDSFSGILIILHLPVTTHTFHKTGGGLRFCRIAADSVCGNCLPTQNPQCQPVLRAFMKSRTSSKKSPSNSCSNPDASPHPQGGKTHSPHLSEND